jgi:hypothetical protein
MRHLYQTLHPCTIFLKPACNDELSSSNQHAILYYRHQTTATFRHPDEFSLQSFTIIMKPTTRHHSHQISPQPCTPLIKPAFNHAQSSTNQNATMKHLNQTNPHT